MPTIDIKNPDGTIRNLYTPSAKGLLFHQHTAPSLLAYGNRGGGKSTILRWDCHLRALTYPNANLILVRDTFPQLLRSHILDLRKEMPLLGGTYRETDHSCRYPNGSTLFLTHVSSDGQALDLLSAQFLMAAFDELSTVDWEFFVKLSASVRVEKGSGRLAVVRAATNPLGPSAAQIKSYFIDKDVDPSDDPDYIPDDWDAIKIQAEDNAEHLDLDQYKKRFSGLPAHVRKAWVDGDFVTENALFDVRPTIRDQEGVERPYHILPSLPDLNKLIRDCTIYRCLDFGWAPDPSICLWIAHLGNRYIVFKERLWNKTPAAEIAADILADSKGMRVAATFADPSCDINTGLDIRTMRDVIEHAGLPLEMSVNNREQYASAIHGALQTEAYEGTPKIQIYGPGCPYLAKTLPLQRYDPHRPLALANHKDDHGAVALAYFLMSFASIDKQAGYEAPGIKPWMKVKPGTNRVLGRDAVRR